MRFVGGLDLTSTSELGSERRIMTLGELLGHLSHSVDELALFDLGLDLATLARACETAERLGESPTAYVFAACRSLIEQASEEEWTTLAGRMQTSFAPGDELISMAVERRLRRDEALSGRSVPG